MAIAPRKPTRRATPRPSLSTPATTYFPPQLLMAQSAIGPTMPPGYAPPTPTNWAEPLPTPTIRKVTSLRLITAMEPALAPLTTQLAAALSSRRGPEPRLRLPTTSQGGPSQPRTQG